MFDDKIYGTKVTEALFLWHSERLPVRLTILFLLTLHVWIQHRNEQMAHSKLFVNLTYLHKHYASYNRCWQPRQLVTICNTNFIHYNKMHYVTDILLMFNCKYYVIQKQQHWGVNVHVQQYHFYTANHQSKCKISFLYSGVLLDLNVAVYLSPFCQNCTFHYFNCQWFHLYAIHQT